jgi:peptide/nickel transport system permease protein
MAVTTIASRSVRRRWRMNSLSIGLLILGVIVAISVLGPVLANPKHAQIGSFAPRLRPSEAHLLGTDTQGRDLFTVLLLATPQTLFIGFAAGAVGVAVGTVLGLLSGFFSGPIDSIIQTITDVAITVPGIAILVVIATNLRTVDVGLMALVVASLSWRFPTRTVRAQTLSLRERAYIQMGRLNGVGGLELVIFEVLPNLLPYIAASLVSTVSQSLLAAIGLEALGLGPQNEYTLGMMLYWAQFYSAILRGMWWWWLPPILVIASIFVGLLFTSAGMDQFVNVRLRRVE